MESSDHKLFALIHRDNGYLHGPYTHVSGAKVGFSSIRHDADKYDLVKFVPASVEMTGEELQAAFEANKEKNEKARNARFEKRYRWRARQ